MQLVAGLCGDAGTTSNALRRCLHRITQRQQQKQQQFKITRATMPALIAAIWFSAANFSAVCRLQEDWSFAPPGSNCKVLVVVPVTKPVVLLVAMSGPVVVGEGTTSLGSQGISSNNGSNVAHSELRTETSSLL